MQSLFHFVHEGRRCYDFKWSRVHTIGMARISSGGRVVMPIDNRFDGSFDVVIKRSYGKVLF